jgi:hypothetical protein
MGTYEFLATALVMGIIAPLFWLGVNVLDGWVQRNVYPRIRIWWAEKMALLREKVARRQPGATTQQLSRPGGVGEKHIGD